MKFSIYSELQWWPGKEPTQVYAEVLEQIENAERVGFDTYSAIEHFFFPKFSASPDPIALFSAAAQRTSRISFRTLVHVLPYHNPMVLASRIAVRGHPDGRPVRVRRRPRPRLDPVARGRRYGEMVERYDESLEILFTALESGGEPFSYEGKFFDVHDARIVPPPRGSSASSPAARRDKTYILAARRAGASSSRRSSPTRRCASSSTSTGRSARSTATSRTSSGSTRATSTRTATRRCARPRRGSRASSPATRRRSSSTRSRRPTS